MNRIILLFSVLGLLSFTACGGTEQEENNLQEEQLLGRWEIQEATRNGSPTESLDGLYFEFMSDGGLRTNIAGTPEEGTYEMDGMELQQRGTAVDADYTIEELTESSLVLTTRLRDFDFRFVLDKQIMEE